MVICFAGERGGSLSEGIYGRVWQKARIAALSKAEAASPLALRPYDLRHARIVAVVLNRRGKISLGGNYNTDMTP